jgi:hypothetical protein
MRHKILKWCSACVKLWIGSHHFDANPDLDPMIVINMEIRIRIGIKTMPIHNTGIRTEREKTLRFSYDLVGSGSKSYLLIVYLSNLMSVI